MSVYFYLTINGGAENVYQIELYTFMMCSGFFSLPRSSISRPRGLSWIWKSGCESGFSSRNAFKVLPL